MPSGFFSTISPKNFDIKKNEDFRKFLDNCCRDYVLVHEQSDGGHDHWHMCVVLNEESTTSKWGQKLKRFWERHDPDLSKHTVDTKKLFQGGGEKTGFDYIMKSPVDVWWKGVEWGIDTYHDDLWPHVPLEERRANVKWRLFLNLNELCKKHEVDVGLGTRGCRVAMNTLAWKHRVYECPLDSRKFDQIAVGWWKYRTQYTGDVSNDPNVKYAGICRDCCKKRKADQIEAYDDMIRSRWPQLGPGPIYGST